MLGKIIDGIDKVPNIILLIINIVIAVFIFLAHGGYLVVKLLNNDFAVGACWEILFVSLPLSIYVLISSVFVLLKKGYYRGVIFSHAIILTFGFVLLMIYAFEILISDLPLGENFAWTLGLLTFYSAYTTFIFRKSVLEKYLQKNIFCKYLHLFVFVIVLVVDNQIYDKYKIARAEQTMKNINFYEEPNEWLNNLKEKNIVKQRNSLVPFFVPPQR